MTIKTMGIEIVVVKDYIQIIKGLAIEKIILLGVVAAAPCRYLPAVNIFRFFGNDINDPRKGIGPVKS